MTLQRGAQVPVAGVGSDRSRLEAQGRQGRSTHHWRPVSNMQAALAGAASLVRNHSQIPVPLGLDSGGQGDTDVLGAGIDQSSAGSGRGWIQRGPYLELNS